MMARVSLERSWQFQVSGIGLVALAGLLGYGVYTGLASRRNQTDSLKVYCDAASDLSSHCRICSVISASDWPLTRTLEFTPAAQDRDILYLRVGGPWGYAVIRLH